jgi:hypothetical protein
MFKNSLSNSFNLSFVNASNLVVTFGPVLEHLTKAQPSSNYTFIPSILDI